MSLHTFFKKEINIYNSKKKKIKKKKHQPWYLPARCISNRIKGCDVQIIYAITFAFLCFKKIKTFALRQKKKKKQGIDRI